jgi:hypothetical protein
MVLRTQSPKCSAGNSFQLPLVVPFKVELEPFWELWHGNPNTTFPIVTHNLYWSGARAAVCDVIG